MATRELVIFNVAGERFGVDIMQIDSVENPLQIFKVPGAPDFIEGLINLRGNVYTVLDLARRFNLSEKGIDETSKIIILKQAAMKAGLIVDGVDEIVVLDENNIESISQVEISLNKKYLNGMVNRDGKKVFLLDLAQVFT